jgi:hypothetical protein
MYKTKGETTISLIGILHNSIPDNASHKFDCISDNLYKENFCLQLLVDKRYYERINITLTAS